MKRTKELTSICIVLAIILVAAAFTVEEISNSSIANKFDASDIIMIFVGSLAFALGIISLIAYRRDGRTKLLFITAAFFLFTLKGVLTIGSDMLSLQQPALDIIASLLDFAVLISFFLGMIKK